MTTELRRVAQRQGHRAERLAALALQLKGYRIVKRRYRTRLGEVDLIARRGKLVAIVEVKARPTLQQAVDAVTPAAWRRISNSAELWLMGLQDAGEVSIRFDIVAVRPWRWPVHISGAWQPV